MHVCPNGVTTNESVSRFNSRSISHIMDDRQVQQKQIVVEEHIGSCQPMQWSIVISVHSIARNKTSRSGKVEQGRGDFRGCALRDSSRYISI